ncbi:MAG: UDP-glucose 4-epimerase, partial [Acidimicrobiaceae bacterium]|nr:UDP-glucose 4-epimerase [Acidimicrobiaceae bacterium]
SNVLGAEIVTPVSKALALPAVPAVFGFDPLLQFVEEDDVIRALEFVMRTDLSGIYNVAGDGRLPWSEVATMAGKRQIFMPPLLTGLSAAPLTRLGLVELPDEVIDLLRYGRGVDNSRLKRAGFDYRFTSAGAVDSFRKGYRLRKIGVLDHPQYKYERDVETFFRQSPAVIRPERLS